MAIILYESYYGIENLGSSTLSHHGIKGQKWGVRRFQNPDGTLIHPKGRRKAKTGSGKKKGLSARQKKILKGAAIGVGAAAAGYAAYRFGSKQGRQAASALKAIKDMDDDELLAVVGRLEKEKKVLELERDIEEFGRGKADKILRKAGAVAVVAMANAGAVYGAKQAVRIGANALGKDGDKIIRDMFPKKK